MHGKPRAQVSFLNRGEAVYPSQTHKARHDVDSEAFNANYSLMLFPFYHIYFRLSIFFASFFIIRALDFSFAVC